MIHRLLPFIFIFLSILTLFLADSFLISYLSEILPDSISQPLSARVHMTFFLLGCSIVLIYSVTRYARLVMLSRDVNAIATYIANLKTHRFSQPPPKIKIAFLGILLEKLTGLGKFYHTELNLIEKEKNQLTTVLESMIEGVITVSKNKEIMAINKTALSMLGASKDSVGKYIHEVIRHNALMDFITKSLSSPTPIEADIDIKGPSPLFIQAHGVPILGNNSAIGSVIVLNNITRIKKLENMRKDFVSNVSHELKTPITLIRGFVETVMEEAQSLSESSRNFLAITLNNTKRLNHIIEDLLDLSRIELIQDKKSLDTTPSDMVEVVHNAIQFCLPNINDRPIQIQYEGPETCPLDINAGLIEQAVINLLENAIKYNPDLSLIVVRLEVMPSSVLLHIRDNGRGIEQKHLPHIFERFYRVDKGRSRDLGGTGLGLAIVKHILQAHGGSVSVTSELNKGTTFTLILPL